MSGILQGIASKLLNDDSRESEYQDISGMLTSIFNLDGDSGASITTVAKKTLVGSNVYIESSLSSEDDFMVPLMGTLAQVYVGYVLTALQVYQSVDRYRTISDSVGRIATEAVTEKEMVNVDPKDIIDSMFSGVATGMEAARDNRFRNDTEESVKHLAAGRLIEFDFHIDVNEELAAEGRNNDIVTVPMYVQLYPTSMPTDVAEALVQFNYPERFWRRLAKVAAREIRFFRDFILGMDMVHRHREILKQDTNNVLSDFYKTKYTKQTRRISDILTGRKRNNIANSILVISSETFKSINDEASIDLASYSDRQRFFNEAYAMMMVVVDLNYNIVEMYYNGIPKKSEMPFRAIKQAGSTKSGIDLEELMNTIAKGAAPKF